MSIWHTPPSLEHLNQTMRNTLGETLDMRFEAFTEDSLTASMVVDRRTHQPMGLLHGGASVALAETLGSVASFLCIDTRTHYAVGLEINANHLRSLRSGRVTGVVTPIHLGRGTHVWDIRLQGEDGRTSCISRLTMAILSHAKS